MKQRSKVIATSIATIAMCASLAVGGTFALFTSESEVNIAVTSGTVDVKATIGELTLTSTVGGVTTAGEDGKWVNGGTATVDGDTITLDKMTPGDTVSFNITVTNYSDVAVKTRTIYTAQGELLGALTIDGFGEVQKAGVTLWRDLDVASEDEVYSVTITLNENAGDEYQEKSAAITFGVEAVQGNAQVDDPFTVRYGDTEEKYVSLKAALEAYKAAEASDVVIDVAAGTYYDTNVVVEQIKDKNLTIRADKDATFANNASGTPVCLVDGDSRYTATEKLTFDGLNFNLDNGAYGIKFASGNEVRYAHNVTVQDCSFVGTDNTGYGLQAGNNSSSYKIDVLGCTVQGISGFVTMYSSDLTVSGCTATNINGFVNNLTASAKTTVVGCNATINGANAEYGVRVNGATLSVSDSTLTLESKSAFSTGAIVVRGATNVTLTDNTISATVVDNVKGVVATICQIASDLANVTSDQAYTLTTGYKNATAGYALKAWYNETGVKEKESYLIYNENGLMYFSNYVAKVDTTIELCADLDMTGKEMQPIQVGANNAITFNGNNHTISNIKIGAAYANGMTGAGNEVAGLFDVSENSGATLTVNNLTIKDADVTCFGYAAVIVGYANNDDDVITLNNVDVIGATVVSDSVAAHVGYTVGSLTMTDCDVSELALTGEVGRPEKVGAFVGTANTASCVATLTNCTNESSYNIAGRVINDATLTVDGVYCVTTASALQAALEAGNKEIYIAANITLTNSLAATDVTFVGLGENAGINFNGWNIGGTNSITYSNLNLTTISLPQIPENGERYGWYGGIDYNGHSVANYENCTISGVFTTYSKTINATRCTFNSYVQEGEEYYNIFLYGSGTVNATDCIFMYRDRAIKIYSEGTADFELNITGGKFVATEDYSVNKALINVDSTYFTSAKVNVSGVQIDEKLATANKYNDTDNTKVTISWN